MKCSLWALFFALVFASKSKRRATRQVVSTELMRPSALNIETASVPVSHARPVISKGIGSVGWAMYMDRKPDFALALQEGDMNRAIRSIMNMYIRRMGKIALCVNISRLTNGSSVDPRVFLLFLVLDSFVNMQRLISGGDEYWLAATLPVHKLFVILWRLEGFPFFLCFTLFPELFHLWTFILFLDIFWSLSYENSVGKLIQ